MQRNEPLGDGLVESVYELLISNEAENVRTFLVDSKGSEGMNSKYTRKLSSCDHNCCLLFFSRTQSSTSVIWIHSYGRHCDHRQHRCAGGLVKRASQHETSA